MLTKGRPLLRWDVLLATRGVAVVVLCHRQVVDDAEAQRLTLGTSTHALDDTREEPGGDQVGVEAPAPALAILRGLEVDGDLREVHRPIGGTRHQPLLAVIETLPPLDSDALQEVPQDFLVLVGDELDVEPVGIEPGDEVQSTLDFDHAVPPLLISDALEGQGEHLIVVGDEHLTGLVVESSQLGVVEALHLHPGESASDERPTERTVDGLGGIHDVGSRVCRHDASAS